MLKLPDEIIKEIAEQLDCGMKCFYNTRSGELVAYPDALRMSGEIDEEIWGDEIEKVEENFHEYFSFHGMESHESFGVMEDFISLIQDEKIKANFEEIIQRRKPFQQFKNLLLYHPELRQQWFVYKDARYKEYLLNQLALYNTGVEGHFDEKDDTD
ncbi:MAG: UPF0158 family protein [Chitinophagaceae bacterium]